ncbi:MAG: ACT domain-containing protein [Bacillota bacterium]
MRVPVQEVAIQYEGTVAELETSFITKALLSGFLGARVDITVNEVNAGMMQKKEELRLVRKLLQTNLVYENCLEVNVIGDNQNFVLKGTHIPNYGERIVGINDFDIDFYPTGHLLYIQHQDKPGVIGRVGKLLGDHEVNIATMQVGRKEKGREAIMMLAFDRALDDKLINQLAAYDDIVSVKTIDL